MGPTLVWRVVTFSGSKGVVRMLVERGARPEGLFSAGWQSNVSMLKLLLELGAELDEVAEDETPFLHCWKNGRFKAAEFLLKQGADVNFQDSRGRTALHFSLQKKHEPERLSFLASQGADPDVADASGVTPRARAARKRDDRFHGLFP